MTKSFLSKSLTGVLGLVLLLCVIGAVNVTLRNLRLRADLTENRLYSLSDATRSVLKKLEEPSTLKFFFSKSSESTPVFIKNYAAQVADLLREYERSSGGNIILESYDVKPDSDDEDLAQRYGVEPQQMNPMGAPVYFGLVIVSPDGREEAISAFSPAKESSLEYDITRLITRSAWPEKPVVGVMTSFSEVLGKPGNPMMGSRGSRGWIVFEELKKDYTLESVAVTATEIPAEIKTLMVVHPKNLSDATLFALDQFVLRGGRLLAFVDPFSYLDFSQSMAEPDPANQPGPSTLGRLFDAWGVRFDTDQVVVDERATTTLRGENGAQEQNPAFLSLKQENMVKTEILTSRFSILMFPYSGLIKPTAEKPAGLAFAPLVRTSDDASATASSQTIRYGGMAAMRSAMTKLTEGAVVAARLTGTFPTAFPDGFTPPKAEGAEAEPLPVEGLKEGKSTVILFADADFLYDSFSATQMNFLGAAVVRPLNDNLALVANAVEQASGSEELIAIRTRGTFSRPFTRVDDLLFEASQKWQAKEAELSEKLQTAQQKLNELQRQKQGNDRFILSPEQQKQIEAFKEERIKTARELKEVRRSLNHDIEQLGRRLKALNILGVPLVVAVLGIVYGLRRRKRK